MNDPEERRLVRMAALRLKSFTMRQALRLYAHTYLGIPLELSDSDALRVFRLAMEDVEGKI